MAEVREGVIRDKQQHQQKNSKGTADNSINNNSIKITTRAPPKTAPTIIKRVSKTTITTATITTRTTTTTTTARITTRAPQTTVAITAITENIVK